jgi:hypothetical protein
MDEGISRRRFFETTAGAAIGAAAFSAVDGDVAAQAPATAVTAANQPGELVLTNGRIHTMDARNSVARTVTIRDGRIAAVGDTPPGRRAGARVIDLRGRTVVPGLIEPHVHIVSLANRPGYHTILENTRSIREVQEALAARRKEVPGRAVDHLDGRLASESVGRASSPTPPSWTPQCPIAGALYERFTGPCATNSMGKAFFDMMDAAPRCIPTEASAAGRTGAIAQPVSPAVDHRQARCSTCAGCRRSTTSCEHGRRDALFGAARLTAHLDQVLFPTPGRSIRHRSCRTSISTGCTTRGSICTGVGKALVRLQMNFCRIRTIRQLPELHERLRNQFQYFGDDMADDRIDRRVGGAARVWRTWRTPQRLVAQAGWHNENSVHNIRS